MVMIQAVGASLVSEIFWLKISSSWTNFDIHHDTSTSRTCFGLLSMCQSMQKIPPKSDCITNIKIYQCVQCTHLVKRIEICQMHITSTKCASEYFARTCIWSIINKHHLRTFKSGKIFNAWILLAMLANAIRPTLRSRTFFNFSA